MRTNKCKQNILSLLSENHLLSIKDIQNKLGEGDFSTIFRNVVSLEKEKNIKKIIIEKDIVLYELVSHNHNHFICNKCKSVREIFFSNVSKILPQDIKIYDVTVRGLCNKCNK